MNAKRARTGRRIAILGAGREGRAALGWLRVHEPDAELTVIAEQQPETEISPWLRPREQLIVEPLSAVRLQKYDLLVRSPGISPYREPLRIARERGAAFTTATNLWFAAHPGARTVCITGTKGKSTTAALLAHLLHAAGLRVRLAGNIGVPLLGCEITDVDWWVIELSSYQIADLEAHPDIAVILNLSPEHLDWHGSAEVYFADKLRLADLVRDGGLILNGADSELTRRFGGRRDLTWFGSERGLGGNGNSLQGDPGGLAIQMPASLPGRHNRMNAAAALAAAEAVGADRAAAIAAIATFEGLPHRLQVLGERGGITYVNDSIASTPVATAAALEALAGRTVVLLVGGFDRGVDWTPYLADFTRYCPRAIIGLPDSGARIVERLRAGGVRCANGLHVAADLGEGLQRARSAAQVGDVILLSPGAPSFPRFADYRARGQAFARVAGFPPFVE